MRSMTAPAKPKVVHVYRHPYAGLECNDAPEHDNYIRLNGLEYLGEYAPRGPVVREWWETRCEGWTERYDTRAEAVRSRQFEAKEHGCAPRIVHVVRRKVCR